MNKNLSRLFICLAIICRVNDAKTQAMPPPGFISTRALVNGLEIHYVTGGHGDLLVLLHGFGENWYMWDRLMPELSRHFTVLAPDLRGIGESGRPTDGYSKVNMAEDIHELVKLLGYKNILLAGHDIGMMVAYAYAASHPDEVKKLALMDAAIPGIDPIWSQKKASAWWFGFFSWPAASELLRGRESVFLNNFWAISSHNHTSFTETEKREFIRAYSTADAMARSFNWYVAFGQDAKDNEQFAAGKLQMPVLAMGGQFGASNMADQCSMVALHVKSSVIPNSGHWLVEENTSQVEKELLDFFLNESTR